MTDQQTSRTNITEALRERLAALEHEQWEQWSRTVAEQGLTPERIERWQRFWVPYEQLDEPTKDFDREWADKVLAILATEPRSDAVTAPDEPSTDWRWLLDVLEAKVRRLGEINDELFRRLQEARAAHLNPADSGSSASVPPLDSLLDAANRMRFTGGPKGWRMVSVEDAGRLIEAVSNALAAKYAAETPEQGRGDE